MGFFSKMFEKPVCPICGKEIGMFSRNKLADAVLCDDCAKNLSPFFKAYKQSTTDQIREQLAYREENKAKVAAFHPTKTVGKGTKVMIDEDNGNMIITDKPNWQDANPDVIPVSSVTGANLDIHEDRREIYRKDSEGHNVSFNPPRYEYDYDYSVIITVDHPYFSEIKVVIANNVRGDSRQNDEMRHTGESIVRDIENARRGARKAVQQANAPKQAVTCPWCGATTMPDANGCCEYCGGSLNG